MTAKPPLQKIRFIDEEDHLSPNALRFLQDLVDTMKGVTAGSVVTVSLGSLKLSVGVGSPNSVVTGSPPDIYLNVNGGAATTLYVKESGSATNTGWVGK